jgi:hypothetical protein
MKWRQARDLDGQSGALNCTKYKRQQYCWHLLSRHLDAQLDAQRCISGALLAGEGFGEHAKNRHCPNPRLELGNSSNDGFVFRRPAGAIDATFYSSS